MLTKKGRQIVKIVTSCATVLLIALIGVVVYQYVKINKLEKTTEKLDSQIIELQNQRTNLEEGIKNRSTNTFVEDCARDYLGMLRDGEVVFIIK